MSTKNKEPVPPERQSRWYFGGLAAAGASCFTHPLDLIKVQMQTQKGKPITLIQLVKQIFQNQGIMGFYSGISASILRQLTYSTVRFAIYENGKQRMTPKDGKLSFLMSTLIAAIGGFAGGFVGSPADLVNVRMQNDIKLPPDKRRNYKNAIHGLYVVSRDEGIRRMWAGGSMTCVRASVMTVGQIAFYDLWKSLLISNFHFEDNVLTHVTASALAGGIATALTQPIDVLKTRTMSMSPSEFKGITNIILNTAKEGPLAFFKGFVPAFVRYSRWYFGGLAAAGASCFTHPLDLIKVQVQTQKDKSITLLQLTKQIFQNQGIMGFYRGISASVLRQLTYSTVRFAIYENGKQRMTPKDGKLSFLMSTLLAAVGGFAGGFAGSPADLVNVRMQNDIKLPPDKRRNYKNAIHGLYIVSRDEGIRRMWAGGSLTCVRASVMTIGQIAFYDLWKAILISNFHFEDNVVTHISASALAGGIATALTQPIDVVKTRTMSMSPSEFKGITNIILNTAKEGPLAFFKGFIPALVRLGPHTILTFVFLEQLRMNFGFVK